MAHLGSGNTISRGGGGDGFFSFLNPVLESVQKGLEFGGEQLLPRYFAKEFLGQNFDQLYNPTFYAPAAPPRQGPINTTSGIKKTGLLFDNINLTGGSMLLAAVAILGVVILIKD